MYIVERKLDESVAILDDKNNVIAEIFINKIFSAKKIKLGFILKDDFKITRKSNDRQHL